MLIDRDEAKKAMLKQQAIDLRDPALTGISFDGDLACEILDRLPSAEPKRCEDCVNLNKTRLLIPQPEQKTGKWIEKEICLTKQKEEMQVARCSNCKKYLTTPHIYCFYHYSFCPHCGARMEG